MESLVPAILEQKVTGIEAFRAWRALVVRYGERAPGPPGTRACASRRRPKSSRGCRTTRFIRWAWSGGGPT